MSLPRILLIGALLLFIGIGVVGWTKRSSHAKLPSSSVAKTDSPMRETPVIAIKTASQADDFPMVDRIFQLFTTSSAKFPIVETVVYSSSAPWLKGKPAWIADYATYYGTSRHFIARSLHGKPDYFNQKVREGSRFNVFCKDKRFQFYLLVDLTRLKMGFYYVDLDTNERVLLKTYRIAAGRIDTTKSSGCLTPIGRYSLGDKVAIYQPGTTCYFQNQKTEMIRVFGTRWIPFDQDLLHPNTAVKGYGIYGAPWKDGSREDRECIGKYDTDGGIRMVSEDLEELFAIVITKPTFVEIVRDFHEAKLPGVEVATPRR